MASISEDTEITISVKSLVAVGTLLLTFAVTYFDTVEQLHVLQMEVALLKDDLSEIQANIRELAVREMDR